MAHTCHTQFSSTAVTRSRYKNFWARARIGLWRGVRDRFSTVSTTVHQPLNDVARGMSGIMLQHGHRSQSLCNPFTMEPGRRDRLRSRVCSDWHRILTATSARVVAMSPSRRRWNRSKCASVRGTRAKRGSRHRSREKKFPSHPLTLSRTVSFPRVSSKSYPPPPCVTANLAAERPRLE